MVPHDLQSRRLDLPGAADGRIVVITGSSLRHDRFALLVASRFPRSFHTWIRVRTPEPDQVPACSSRAWRRVALAVRHPERIPGLVRDRLRRRWVAVPSLAAEERVLFQAEVQRLRESVCARPFEVSNPNAADVVERVAQVQPYFILTLGGALYSRKLIGAAKGIALNQHDGWCPDYRGSHTVDWTLYHRDYRVLGSTVHVLTSGMDAGAIVRRSGTCLTEDDNRHRAFLRTVALGTDLMCEAVASIMEVESVQLYEQPGFGGRTYLRREMDDDLLAAVDSDLERRIFAKGLRALQAI